MFDYRSDEDVFCEMFSFSISELAATYDMNRADKGDSWQNMGVAELRELLYDKRQELAAAISDSLKEYNGLVDVILVGMMFLTKLDKVKDEKHPIPNEHWHCHRCGVSLSAFGRHWIDKQFFCAKCIKETEFSRIYTCKICGVALTRAEIRNTAGQVRCEKCEGI